MFKEILKLMKNLTKKNIITTFILLFFIVILIFIIYFGTLFFKENKYLFNNKYIHTKKRDTYIIKNVDDTLINSYISKDNNTLIVFWASWCQACIEESAELNNFINNNPDITVLVVSFDKSFSDLENYLSTTNYNWFIILDPNRKIRQSLDTDTKGIPAAYLINSNLDVIAKDISTMNEEQFLKFYNLTK